MKHDHLTDEDDAVEEIEELVQELGDKFVFAERHVQDPTADRVTAR